MPPRDDAPGAMPPPDTPLAALRARVDARPRAFIALMAVVTALGPLSLQIFLPALPAIRAAFTVAPGTAQLVLSASMVTIAIATLAWGPAADRFGRRPVMIAGLVLFVAGSAIAAAAPDIWVLIGGRVIQAVGGASGMVVTTTIIRDLFDRERAAQVMAYTITAFIAAPMVAPVIGGVLADWAGWRTVFAFSAGAGVAVAAFAVTRVPETRLAGSASPGLVASFAIFAGLLRRPRFLANAVMLSFAISAFMAFAGGAPYVMTTVLGRAPSSFGIDMALLSAGFMAGTMLTARLTPRYGIERMIFVGCAIAAVGAAGGLVAVGAFAWSPLTITGPAIVVAFAYGLMVPNGQTAAVSVEPTVAGSASGLTRFMQWTTGAVFAQVAGMVQDGTPWPMMVLLALAAGAALAAIVVIPRWGMRQAGHRR